MFTVCATFPFHHGSELFEQDWVIGVGLHLFAKNGNQIFTTGIGLKSKLDIVAGTFIIFGPFRVVDGIPVKNNRCMSILVSITSDFSASPFSPWPRQALK
jgi:hypothetical protein